MSTSFQMAREFHEALELPVARTLDDLSTDRLRLRLTLIGEEVGELVAAMCGMDEVATDRVRDFLRERFLGYTRFARPVDLAEVAKELVDVHVVVSGAAVEYGIPEDDVYAEVHASNMAKAGGPRRMDGKVLKPKGWQPPDVVRVLREAA